ncbi:MAG: nucleotidyltransferase substrate binding protein [Deltaproteobacteria bacterium]|nr:nucleotidyltransferase substrate binding protein [Deltaproteobacteria bacterium]
MPLDLTSLRRAAETLQRVSTAACSEERLAVLDDDLREAIRAGVIQSFEFTYELCWKFMKRWLEANLGRSQVDGVSRRHLFRLAAEHRLIENVDRWMDHHHARNRTSHTYDDTIAQEVFENAIAFVDDARGLLGQLEKRND